MTGINNIPQFLKDHRWTVDRTTNVRPTTELYLSDAEQDTVVISRVVKGIGHTELKVAYNQANPQATVVVDKIHGHDAYDLFTTVSGADQKQHAKDINLMDMGMIIVDLKKTAQAGGA